MSFRAQRGIWLCFFLPSTPVHLKTRFWSAAACCRFCSGQLAGRAALPLTLAEEAASKLAGSKRQQAAALQKPPRRQSSIENRQLPQGHLLNCLLSASPCIWYEEPIWTPLLFTLSFRAKRGTSHCRENTQSEIPRCARNDRQGITSPRRFDSTFEYKGSTQGCGCRRRRGGSRPRRDAG